MKTNNKSKRTTADKVALFRSLFSGLPNVYGTYDPDTGHAWQEKKPVTHDTILAHLKGKSPYGVYLLDGRRTRAIAVDFDDSDTVPPIEFVNRAEHYQLPAYIEVSKSKGFHVWIFFNENGIQAFKARRVVKHILEEIGYPCTEIFPKQDLLDTRASYGNFINVPMFGRLVPKKKTVFVDPSTFEMYPDQWAFLESVERVSEQVLDEIIEINDLSISTNDHEPPSNGLTNNGFGRFSLPPCAQKMFRDGVTQLQRVSCFRLAVHLKRMGLPFDVAMAALRTWSLKNKPSDGKGVIREDEIRSQASYAYDHSYNGYGCGSEAVSHFCEQTCPVKNFKKN